MGGLGDLIWFKFDAEQENSYSKICLLKNFMSYLIAWHALHALLDRLAVFVRKTNSNFKQITLKKLQSEIRWEPY